MRFVFNNLERILLAELRSATNANIAVAFFNPEDAVLAALQTVPDLKLIVSEDFEINNPYKLECLAQSADVWMVPADAAAGKLHAKVFLVRRHNGSSWGLVGSANLTRPGLSSNQEACVILESSELADRIVLDEIEAWFNRLEHVCGQIDFTLAKEVFNTRARYRLDITQPREATTEDETRYWALKTTEGATGQSHWQDFLAENVIAIGWPLARVNPAVVKREVLEEAIKEAYPGEDYNRAATKILWFVRLLSRDVVLICRGYNSQQTGDVHIYGIARITGSYRYEPNSWWIHKHKAILQIIDERLPVQLVRDALRKKSLMQTLHLLLPEEFEGFARVVQHTLGIGINI
ncbi:MAG: 5-methylcytosine-specific restriction enzyme [Blastocatellia bacterium]|jgi:HKD family nuclease|nr:5-methylcytosine-specific restriction enzyme [Blastocatellia bacterium]